MQPNNKYNLFIRSNGVCYASFTDDLHKRKQISLYTKDEQIATEKIDMLNMEAVISNAESLNFITQIAVAIDGSIKQQFKHKPPVIDLFNRHFIRYQQTIKNISYRHMESYKLLAKLLKYYDITWDHLDNAELLIDFQEKLRLKYSPVSVEKQMTLFRVFINWLYKNNYITDKMKNYVLSNIIRENKHRIIKAKSIITIHDFDLLLKHVYSKDKDFYWYLVLRYVLCTRIEELKLLQVKRIKIKIIDVFQLKTQRLKSITIPPLLMGQLKLYIKECALFSDNLLFKGATKNNKYYYLKFKQALKDLNLSSDYQLFQIRHFSATLVDELFDKDTAMLYLGHANSKDVTSRYICNETQKTLKVSNALCSLIPDLQEFSVELEVIQQNNLSNSTS